MKERLHIFYFSTLAIFWGGSFLAIHYVVDALPPTFGALLRVATALVAVSTLMLFTKTAKIPLNIKLQAMGAGVLDMGASWIFLFYGEKFVSPALASIYNSSSTIFAALFAPLILAHTSLNRKNVLGVLIGFAGILAVFGPHISKEDISQVQGQLCIIGMAVCYGAGVTWLKRFSHSIRATSNLFYQGLGAFIVLAIYSSIFESPWRIDFASVPMSAWWSVLYLGICSTFIAWLMFIRLIRDRGSVQATSVTYALPIVSIILDIIFLGRLVRLTDIVGTFIILAGVWLIQKRYKGRI